MILLLHHLFILRHLRFHQQHLHEMLGYMCRPRSQLNRRLVIDNLQICHEPHLLLLHVIYHLLHSLRTKTMRMTEKSTIRLTTRLFLNQTRHLRLLLREWHRTLVATISMTTSTLQRLQDLLRQSEGTRILRHHETFRLQWKDPRHQLFLVKVVRVHLVEELQLMSDAMAEGPWI